MKKEASKIILNFNTLATNLGREDEPKSQPNNGPLKLQPSILQKRNRRISFEEKT